MGLRGKKCDVCLELFVWVCRLVGLATALGLWGVGVEAAHYKHTLSVYLLVAALIMSLLELVFIMNYFVEICLSAGSRCWKIWDGVLWIDDWKKGILYLVLAVPCFIQPHQVRLALISGCMVIVTALLYMLKTFKTRREKLKDVITQKETYDRFDELQDELDDNIINPSSDLPIMSVADQSEILEV